MIKCNIADKKIKVQDVSDAIGGWNLMIKRVSLTNKKKYAGIKITLKTCMQK